MPRVMLSSQSLWRGSCGCRVPFIMPPLLREPLADQRQFAPAFRGGPGVRHLETIERIEDDLGNDQPRIVLVVRGHDVPRRVTRACRAQESRVRPRVVLPLLPLEDVGKAEFPVLLRLINALEESPALFLLRQVEEHFDGPRSIAMQVAD